MPPFCSKIEASRHAHIPGLFFLFPRYILENIMKTLIR